MRVPGLLQQIYIYIYVWLLLKLCTNHSKICKIYIVNINMYIWSNVLALPSESIVHLHGFIAQNFTVKLLS